MAVYEFKMYLNLSLCSPGAPEGSQRWETIQVQHLQEELSQAGSPSKAHPGSYGERNQHECHVRTHRGTSHWCLAESVEISCAHMMCLVCRCVTGASAACSNLKTHLRRTRAKGRTSASSAPPASPSTCTCGCTDVCTPPRAHTAARTALAATHTWAACRSTCTSSAPPPASQAPPLSCAEPMTRSTGLIWVKVQQSLRLGMETESIKKSVGDLGCCSSTCWPAGSSAGPNNDTWFIQLSFSRGFH